MTIRRAIKEISEWGVSCDFATYLQKKVALTNEICLVAIAAVIFSSFLFVLHGDPTLLYINFAMMLVFVLTLAFNKFQKIYFSRFFISLAPVLILLLSSYFTTHIMGINYIVFSFAIIAFNLVPLLIFNFLDEKKRFITALGINFFFLVFYDRMLILLEGEESIPQIISDHYTYFKVTQLQLWIFMVVAVMFIKRVNRRFEKRLEDLNLELQQSNKEILTQNEEIAATNEELTQQQEQIVDQRNYIESQNFELKDYQNKLLDYIYELSKTNNKLARKQAENKSILSALRLNFIMLEFDLQANVTWVTAKTCEYLGLGKSKILGKNGAEMFQVIQNGSGNSVSFEMVWDKVLSGEAVNEDFELQIADKDLSISATFAPIMDENGDSVKILAIAEDISSIISQHKIIESKNTLLENQQNEIKERNEELRQQKEEIEAINETLELRVKERTNILEQKNKQLAEYAFINAHLLRAPVSSIIGLINLMGHETLDTRELELYKYLKDSANHLDKIVFKINRAIEMNREFDREFLKD